MLTSGLSNFKKISINCFLIKYCFGEMIHNSNPFKENILLICG